MADAWLAQWTVGLDQFPVAGTDRQKLLALIPWAARAPSSHNAQPWRFRVGTAHLDLRADRSRELPVVDPSNRELIISCGAALGYLLIAARHFGLITEVQLLPDARDADLMARVLVMGEAAPTEHTELLFGAIPLRHTCRLPFEPTPVPEQLCGEMVDAAAAEGVRLRLVRHYRQREVIAHCVQAGDRIQMASARFRAELARWLRPNRPGVDDGMPGYAMGRGQLAAAAAPLAVRTFDLGAGQAAHDVDLLRHTPLLALFETDEDTPAAWLATGQALASVLLLAESTGVRSSFLNQPIEVPLLRTRLARAVGSTGHPQLLLRLGLGPAVSRSTPRRPVKALIDP